ncbi:MAG: NAD(P)-binding protein [Nocardioidaceae bacterium]|nr:NAD(P)-binding protein [Nocardioidaceae bacterium]
MADVAVVGAGLGGLAAAARLAKLGHHVTVFERLDAAGGAMRPVESAGYRWDGGPTAVTIPAVLRDLFRKSGRPIERYVDLVARDVARRHVFADGAVVDLPVGSRGPQIAAVDAGLGPGAGGKWAAYVDAQTETWETLRTLVLDPPAGGLAYADPVVAKRLGARTTVAKLAKRAFKDERLRTMAVHQVVAAGSLPRDVPAYGAVEPYLERSFGVWDVRGGMRSLVEALVIRLDERGVEVVYDTEIAAVHTEADAVSGVETVSGTFHTAQVAVTDLDPRAVFGRLLRHPAAEAGRRIFEVATPATPMAVTHLGLRGDVPALPAEVVLHGDPLIVITTTDAAPAGCRAWSVRHRGAPGEDIVVTMVGRGLDVRHLVVARLERDAVTQIRATGASAYGLAWAGHRAQARRAALVQPLRGMHLVGSGVHPGAGIAYVGWGAAHVAARMGKA